VFNSRAAGWLTEAEAHLPAALHEIGHLHGMADNTIVIAGVLHNISERGSTVMNYFEDKNDHLGALPRVVTPCDRDRAALEAISYIRKRPETSVGSPSYSTAWT
jgi:hypothetical protein